MTTAPVDHLVTLAALQEQFRSTIDAVDPTAPVPWCGRWTVRDLVEHLARVHHWAAAQAARTPEVPLGRGPFDLAPFYAEQAAELHATLTRLGPDAIGSTLNGPGPASFWYRRQVHETLVHLWDLRTAGHLRLDADPTLWADTVDEVVTVMFPRQVRLGRTPVLERPLTLVADDAPRRWTLATADETTDDAAVTVTGPAEALALLLWGRTTPDDPRLSVDGHRPWLTQVLARPLTP